MILWKSNKDEYVRDTSVDEFGYWLLVHLERYQEPGKWIMWFQISLTGKHYKFDTIFQLQINI